MVPWAWVITGIFVCSFVGLAAGLYPAYKASKLDPIVAYAMNNYFLQQCLLLKIAICHFEVIKKIKN